MKVGGMSEANQSDGEGLPVRSWRWRGLRAGSIVFLALVALVALQSAKLIWAVVTPVGPLGTAPTNTIRTVSFSGDFDPFFRLAGPAISTSVTSLPLKLFGTRRDSATGQGAAIIATPDGVQSSFAVGEVIMPGVKLFAVGNDDVTIDRGGAKEKLFLDQSVPAPVAQPNAATSAPSSQALIAAPPLSTDPAARVLVRPDQAPPPPPKTMEQ